MDTLKWKNKHFQTFMDMYATMLRKDRTDPPATSILVQKDKSGNVERTLHDNMDNRRRHHSHKRHIKGTSGSLTFRSQKSWKENIQKV